MLGIELQLTTLTTKTNAYIFIYYLSPSTTSAREGPNNRRELIITVYKITENDVAHQNAGEKRSVFKNKLMFSTPETKKNSLRDFGRLMNM